MEIVKINILDKFKSKELSLKKKNLYLQINQTFRLTLNIIEKIFEDNRIISMLNSNVSRCDPIIWTLGRLLYFWKKYCCDYLNIYLSKKLNDEIFDNIILTNREKYFINLLNVDELFNLYVEIKENISLYLFKCDKLNNYEKYIMRFVHLKNDIINEELICSFHLFGKNYFKPLIKYENSILKNSEFILVPAGSVLQGTKSDYDNSFNFDNEYPPFNAKVNSFKISKYCITNYQFLQFVKDKGYENKKYWSFNGWRYKINKKLKYPSFWHYDEYYKGKEWREKVFDKYYILRLNNPVVNISYYEAEAYCNWIGGRLPTESEFEYLSEFFEDNYKKKGHFNLENGTTISVLNDKNINKLKIVGLFGNVWEFCKNDFYPYDGFSKELLYSKNSYPYFGKKVVSKGGSWCVPEYMVTKSYRNIIDYDCCHKIVGFRVVK
jgi:iron(II)-dependent oxidoreductase